MNRALLVFALMPMLASAADASRISFLEQEVRNLQRQVQALSRQVDEMRRRAPAPSVNPDAKRGAAVAASDRWMDAAKWDSLRAGMGELEVITLLGAPRSMRDEDGARVLLYAAEIGSSGFLGGSVTLRERVVTEVRRPALQ